MDINLSTAKEIGLNLEKESAQLLNGKVFFLAVLGHIAVL